MLDIDYFKQYNDNYGHQEDDKVISSIADIIHKISKNKDIIPCRYGIDEFIIIYCGYTEQDLCKFLRTIKKELELKNIKHKYSKISKKVTVSQGLCYSKMATMQTSDYLKLADEALYDIKTTTKNDYKLIDADKKR